VAALPADANAKCPVAGDPVDPNVSVVYKGRTVYFCCKDCVAKFNKDPEKYMAKLDPPAAAPAAPAKTP
jgi:YHS domain-containing protein